MLTDLVYASISALKVQRRARDEVDHRDDVAFDMLPSSNCIDVLCMLTAAVYTSISALQVDQRGRCCG